MIWKLLYDVSHWLCYWCLQRPVYRFSMYFYAILVELRFCPTMTDFLVRMLTKHVLTVGHKYVRQVGASKSFAFQWSYIRILGMLPTHVVELYSSYSVQYWWLLLEGRTTVESCQFQLYVVETACNRLGFWRRLDWQHRSQTITSGVANWQVFLTRELDSVSNEASRGMYAWWVYSLRGMGAKEVLIMRIPCFLVGLRCMSSLLSWVIKTNIQLAHWYFQVSLSYAYSRLVRHTRPCPTYNAPLRKIVQKRFVRSIFPDGFSLHTMLCRKGVQTNLDGSYDD